ncbi:MAG: M15 family metallopeptidase [Pseudomonadota bacterium]
MSSNDQHGEILIDSRMSFAEAIAGARAPDHVIRELCLVDVFYYSFDGKLHQGQLIVHQSVRQDVEEVFAMIRRERFPIARAVPIVKYRWSDNASMADNNTSAFNYRRVAGTRRLSRHATGHAVDINPRQNPVIYRNGRMSPKGALYRTGTEGTFSEDSPVVRAFIERGWRWGGHFEEMMDAHHFQKP